MSILYSLDVGAGFNVVDRQDDAAPGDASVDLRITRAAGFSKKEVVQLVTNAMADYVKQPDVADETPAGAGLTALIADGDTWAITGGDLEVSITAGVPTFTFTPD